MTHMSKLTHHDVSVASFIYLTTVLESMTLSCVVFRGCTRMECAVTWPLDPVEIAQEVHAVMWPSEYPKSCENRACFQTIFRNCGGCMIVGCAFAQSPDPSKVHTLFSHDFWKLWWPCESTPHSHVAFLASENHPRMGSAFMTEREQCLKVSNAQQIMGIAGLWEKLRNSSRLVCLGKWCKVAQLSGSNSGCTRWPSINNAIKCCCSGYPRLGGEREREREGIVTG